MHMKLPPLETDGCESKLVATKIRITKVNDDILLVEFFAADDVSLVSFQTSPLMTNDTFTISNIKIEIPIKIN